MKSLKTSVWCVCVCVCVCGGGVHMYVLHVLFVFACVCVCMCICSMALVIDLCIHVFGEWGCVWRVGMELVSKSGSL